MPLSWAPGWAGSGGLISSPSTLSMPAADVGGTLICNVFTEASASASVDDFDEVVSLSAGGLKVTVFARTVDGTEGSDVTINVTGTPPLHAASVGFFPGAITGWSTTDLTDVDDSVYTFSINNGGPKLMVGFTTGLGGIIFDYNDGAHIDIGFSVSLTEEDESTILGVMAYNAADGIQDGSWSATISPSAWEAGEIELAGLILVSFSGEGSGTGWKASWTL